MEWEEALLLARGGDMPREPATLYYRRQAARALHVAEGVTAQAAKTRLLDDAVHYDELAANADREAGKIAAPARDRAGKAA